MNVRRLRSNEGYDKTFFITSADQIGGDTQNPFMSATIVSDDHLQLQTAAFVLLTRTILSVIKIAEIEQIQINIVVGFFAIQSFHFNTLYCLLYIS